MCSPAVSAVVVLSALKLLLVERGTEILTNEVYGPSSSCQDACQPPSDQVAQWPDLAPPR